MRGAAHGSAQFVINPAPERGQLSSLQTGLAALPPEAEGVAFIPMDCPAVREETVARLADAFLARDPQTLLVIPRCKDQHGYHRGHPVFAARAIAAELLALPSDAQARDVIHGHVARTQYVDVDDPGILTDVDDPAAYRRLLESGTGADRRIPATEARENPAATASVAPLKSIESGTGADRRLPGPEARENPAATASVALSGVPLKSHKESLP